MSHVACMSMLHACMLHACMHVMCMLRSSHASHVKGEFLTEVVSSVLILAAELMVSSNSDG
jgi:hypothetical protein